MFAQQQQQRELQLEDLELKPVELVSVMCVWSVQLGVCMLPDTPHSHAAHWVAATAAMWWWWWFGGWGW